MLTGAARERLTAAILRAYDEPELRKEQTEEYAYYPTKWVEPYLARRRKIGWDLYSLLGIGREDRAKMHAQHGRNYRFFDDGSVGFLDFGCVKLLPPALVGDMKRYMRAAMDADCWFGRGFPAAS